MNAILLRVVAQGGLSARLAECCITRGTEEKHIGRVGTAANRRQNLELMARKPCAKFRIGGAQRLTRQKRSSCFIHRSHTHRNDKCYCALVHVPRYVLCKYRSCVAIWSYRWIHACHCHSGVESPKFARVTIINVRRRVL